MKDKELKEKVIKKLMTTYKFSRAMAIELIAKYDDVYDVNRNEGVNVIAISINEAYEQDY